MVTIPKGILKDLSLNELTEADFRGLAEPSMRTELSLSSFYKGSITRATFQAVAFTKCNFARATFERINFSRCKFISVDLTRAIFRDCFFSDCSFVHCDPYNASFERTEIDPAAFKNCFKLHSEWNKALILFSSLRLSLKDMGETRSSRTAEYYFRVWQRRRLYHRWHFKKVSGLGPWLRSLCLEGLTGYGERPANLLCWAFAVIAVSAAIYMEWLPYSLGSGGHGFWDYMYYSFKVFFGQGFSAGFQSLRLSFVQITEFLSGLVMVALLIGSVVRKLSP